MQSITVEIEWDGPDDPFWLNPDNVWWCLQKCCKNTRFKVRWAEGAEEAAHAQWDPVLAELDMALPAQEEAPPKNKKGVENESFQSTSKQGSTSSLSAH